MKWIQFTFSSTILHQQQKAMDSPVRHKTVFQRTQLQLCLFARNSESPFMHGLSCTEVNAHTWHPNWGHAFLHNFVSRRRSHSFLGYNDSTVILPYPSGVWISATCILTCMASSTHFLAGWNDSQNQISEPQSLISMHSPLNSSSSYNNYSS